MNKILFFLVTLLIWSCSNPVEEHKDSIELPSRVDFISDHMIPLPSELLPAAIHLSCGLSIREVRGSTPPNLEELCEYTKKNFFKFMEFNGIEINNTPFTWNMSFLPEDDCYRCLNDTSYRFKNRFVPGKVIGYTGKDERYSWMISDYKDPEFGITFVHELFHALSMHYGVYNSHGGSLHDKTNTDEILAQKFTKDLGW